MAKRLANLRDGALELYGAPRVRRASALRAHGVDPADTARAAEIAHLHGLTDGAVQAAFAALDYDAAELTAAAAALADAPASALTPALR